MIVILITYIMCAFGLRDYVGCLRFQTFFFFLAAQFDFSITFQPHKWVPCTVHGIYKHYFLAIFFIKNGSQDTIYTFKNYFTIVFSVFSFQLYSNRPYSNLTFQSLFSHTSGSRVLFTEPTNLTF